MTETEDFGILCDGNGRKWRFANFMFLKQTETEVCKFCISFTDGNGGFADFTFPERTETEVGKFCISVTDRNGGFADFAIPKWTEMEVC